MPDPARSVIGAIGSHISWARTVDRSARTAPGRAASVARWLDLVPAEITDPADRERAAAHLRKAHLLSMNRKSVESRARRKAAEAAAEAAREDAQIARLESDGGAG